MNNTIKKNLKLKLIIILSLFVSLEYTKAQDSKSDLDTYKKNSVYVSYGNVILASQISFSYERMILEKGKMRTKAKVSYGHTLTNHYDLDTNAKNYQNFLSLSGVQLIGLFEMNVGLALAKYKLDEGFDPEPDVDYSEVKKETAFYGSIGVRYTKNDFLFRAGIGNTELLYIGIGMNF